MVQSNEPLTGTAVKAEQYSLSVILQISKKNYRLHSLKQLYDHNDHGHL